LTDHDAPTPRSWATEDPNPAQIKVEKRRIQELGAEGVAKKINPQLVEAVQAVRTLEDGETENLYPIEASQPEPETAPHEDGPTAKRARTENGAGTQNGAGGLLGQDAVENIKYFADLARQQAAEAKAQKIAAKPAAKPNAMGLLGGYGSDSD
jgi:hypothetical protein